MVKLKDEVDAEVRRGSESWIYIYVTLGFMLTIEAGIVALIAPLIWPRNIIVYSALGGLTAYLWLLSGWFQNKLIRCKARYESKPRGTSAGSVLIAVGIVLLAAVLAWVLLVPI
ncbi:MAG: hypothetical protein KME20_22065 [Kaiparowitsia implicata GSE-PSE-MK54-09C]|jgi:uncharacterized membrane protein|nr:hypothetical protein [Kaiparowitsia implicata GSE-PSE-MK54-09C]